MATDTPSRTIRVTLSSDPRCCRATYHVYCGKLLAAFRQDRNRHSHVFYRWFNEIPVLLLIGVIILVVVRPF